MANLVQIWGTGFGSSPASITVTVDGVQTFSGTVPTLDIAPTSFPPPGPTEEQIASLCEIDFTGDTDSAKQVSVTAVAGSVTLCIEKQNNCAIPNPVFSEEQFDILVDPEQSYTAKNPIIFSMANPPFTPEEQAIYTDPTTTAETRQQMREDHNVSTYVSSGDTGFVMIAGETRTNVQLDGVAQDPIRQAGQAGTWNWLIPQGSTLTYTNILPSFY